jgi:hypothetical protein
MRPKIIFIHGMFLNPASWEQWLSYFEEFGYSCEAPAWPLHEGDSAAKNRQLARLASSHDTSLTTFHHTFHHTFRHNPSNPNP